jgi:hypothetical protein
LALFCVASKRLRVSERNKPSLHAIDTPRRRDVDE